MGKKWGMNAYKLAIISLTYLFLFDISACTLPGYYEKTTVRLNKNESITQFIVEEFDGAELDFDELIADIKKEAQAYNEEKDSEAIEVTNVAFQDDVARIILDYKDDDAYYSMNGYAFYYDGCTDAANSGYNPVSKVKSTQNGEYLDADTWNNMSPNYKIAVIHEPIRIETPSNILYVSDNVTLESDKIAITNNEDLAYIIF